MYNKDFFSKNMGSLVKFLSWMQLILKVGQVCCYAAEPCNLNTCNFLTDLNTIKGTVESCFKKIAPPFKTTYNFKPEISYQVQKS